MGQQHNQRRLITAKYPGSCRTCHVGIAAGEQVFYFPTSQKLMHPACVTSREERARQGRSRTANRVARESKPDQTPILSKIYGSRQEFTATFRGECRVCKLTVYPGDRAYFFPKTRTVEHYNCTRRRGTTAGA